jgi:hypothetical protein
VTQAAEHLGGDPAQPTYVGETFSVKAVGRAVVSAGIGQALDRPKQWGHGALGFGKRFASGFATHAVKDSIEFPVAAIRHEDLRYHPSDEEKFGPRLEHALLSTVITQKTTTGNKTIASGRISGSFGSGLISRAWQPVAARGIAGGLASGGISLGADAAANVVQEFWPRAKHTKPVPME